VEFHINTGAPIVALQFNEEGADLFADLTQAHVGEPIGIFLDGELISSPVVQAAIFGGEAIITGDFTVEEARILAQRLNAGALPVPVSLLSQQTVGPILGEVSLEKSVVAAGMGFAFVAAFMIAYYRLPGLIAALALVLYLFLNLACYRLFGVTITLAGITGFVLSLGMAVDANVLIIERLKEELKAGRDHHSATDEAYRRAWPAIRDGNVTTLIATAILYWFSSSFIQGFALTLSIGVILSMFTAIIISRFYHKNVIQWPRLTKRAWLFGHRHQS
jgi:protein-export membrane protein SecD